MTKKGFQDYMGSYSFKRGEFHHFVEWWFASKPLINLWNSCVLKIRLSSERSEHAIGPLKGFAFGVLEALPLRILTDGLPSPILTNKLTKSIGGKINEWK